MEPQKVLEQENCFSSQNYQALWLLGTAGGYKESPFGGATPSPHVVHRSQLPKAVESGSFSPHFAHSGPSSTSTCTPSQGLKEG